MNYKFRELLEFRISIKSFENTNKVGPTHLFQIASPCFLPFPTFWNVASVPESDFTAQMIWWYCAVSHLRGKLAGLSMGMSFLWESHGKRPMGWDGTAHIYSSHETQK